MTGAERSRTYRARRRRHRRIICIEADEFLLTDTLIELGLLNEKAARSPAHVNVAAARFFALATKYFVTHDAAAKFLCATKMEIEEK